MSAIILYHSGAPIPQHLVDCVTKIRRMSDIPIYIITDQAEHPPVDVQWVNMEEDTFNGVKHGLSLLDYYRDSNNPMWQTSCWRMFYIQRLMEAMKLRDVLHFDNDVLLFERPDQIIATCSDLYDTFAITPSVPVPAHVIFGMSYIPNSRCLIDILDWVYDEMAKGWEYLNPKYNHYPCEMILFGSCPLVKDYLPILPSGHYPPRYTNNSDRFNSVFDPSAYGQYMGGTDAEKKPGFIDVGHPIGKLIMMGELRVVREGDQLYVIHGGRKIKLNNLHVHSKQTAQFL